MHDTMHMSESENLWESISSFHCVTILMLPGPAQAPLPAESSHGLYYLLHTRVLTLLRVVLKEGCHLLDTNRTFKKSYRLFLNYFKACFLSQKPF